MQLIEIGKQILKYTPFAGIGKSTSLGFGTDIIPSDYGSNIAPYESQNNMWFFGADGNDYQFSYGGHSDSIKAYCACPPLASVINRKTQCFINGKNWIINTKGKAKGKESDSVIAVKIRNLLNNPNPLQSGKQFDAQCYVYQQLFGYSIVLPIKPIGYTDLYNATALWNIPPAMVDWKETNKLFYQTSITGVIESLILNYKGQKIILPLKDVIILQDTTPSLENLVIPDNNRIRSLRYPINNILGAYESRHNLINYRGARGILTNKASDAIGHVPLTVDERKDLNEQFQKFGLRNAQMQFILTTANLEWQQIGQATKDLMLFEEIIDSTMSICDAFGFPYRLLSSEKSASYNDVSEFKKTLYQDAIIPEAENIYAQYNKMFETSKYGIEIQRDYLHVAILQEDEEKRSRTRKLRNEAKVIEWRNGMITLNEWRESNGEDPMDDARGAMYFPEYVAEYGDPIGKQVDNGSTGATMGNAPTNTDQSNSIAQS